MESEINKKEKAYLKMNEENSKLINELNLRIKEYEDKIKILSERLTSINKEKTELENIIIKQESKVNDLGEKVNKIEALLKNKNEQIQENEQYSLKLINIIKEQKSQLQTLQKEQKISNENSAINDSNLKTINSLKAQIDTLKKKLEVKEDSILTLQKSHKLLQEKYLKICSNNRKKEQEMLINQAKKMKMEKLEREKEQFLKRNKNSASKNEILEKNYSSLSNFKQPKTPVSVYQNQKTTNDSIDSHSNLGGEKKNEVSSIQAGTVLPAIKSTKNKERIERLKLKNEDDGSVEEINDMVTKIMNEF
jgi:chromosome segregation ATPase